MADAFTPNFNLTLPEIGGSFDTWGNKVNANFSALDEALASVDEALASVDVPNMGGIIAMYEGLAADIPAGWALCDGTNGTPDLRDRFAVGAGGAYAPGDVGGASTVTLTEAQLPSHAHGTSVTSAGAHSHTGTTAGAGNHAHSGSTSGAGSHSHVQTYRRGSSSGSGSNIQAGNQIGDINSAGQSTSGVGDHAHSFSTSVAGSHAHTFATSTGGSHVHGVTVNATGGSQAHENKPPYYALAFVKFIGIGA